MCPCVCVCDRRAAAARPSITRVKSMPNEDADDDARAPSRMQTHIQDYRGEFLTPSIIPHNPLLWKEC